MGALRKVGAHTVVLFFMMAQAAELAMKAWLVMDGVPLDQIANRKLYGHDLEQVLEKARARGFAPAAQLQADQWKRLNEVYYKVYYLSGNEQKLIHKQLQYPISDGMVLPSQADTRQMLTAFIDVAAVKVRGKAEPNRLGQSIRFGARH